MEDGTTVKEAEFSQLVLIRSIIRRSDGGAGLAGQTVKVGGWVKNGREQGKGSFAFIELNDGSCEANLQLIIYSDVAELRKCTPIGTCLQVEGVLQLLPVDKKRKQSVEVKVSKVIDVGTVDVVKYPLPPLKSKVSLEFLRDIVHLRPRTNAVITNFFLNLYELIIM